MPKYDSIKKSDRLYQLQRLFEQPGVRLRTKDIAERLGVSDDMTKLYINELESSHRLPLAKDGNYWFLPEGMSIQALRVHLSTIEATSLYIAGRLLSQIHDEQNHHTIMALTRLIEAFPKELQESQRTLIEMALQRQKDQPDRSAIFQAIAEGWVTRRKVKLLYEPARAPKYTCLLSPYMLEPSGIGRTIYAIGKSEPLSSKREPMGKIRTYKLERIESAQLTIIPFDSDESFDGPALLQRAWGVMYSDLSEELITVRLRFSHHVVRRLKETLWHPTQTIDDTPDGCVMTIRIAETLELENWVRGWGSDCVVLEPIELRERIMDDVRRSMHNYGLNATTSDDDDDYSSF